MVAGKGDRPYEYRSEAEIHEMIREANDAIKTHNRYLDEIDNKYRGQSPGPEMYAGEVGLISSYHTQIADLKRELDIRANERAQKGKTPVGFPPAIADWLAQMGANASTRIEFTWAYKGNRFFGVPQPVGTVKIYVQVPRGTAGVEKLGPTVVLPANGSVEYDRAMQAAGWKKR